MQLVLLKRLILIFGLTIFWIIEVKHAIKLAERNRAMLRRIRVGRENLKPKICYDLVGCFADPPPHLRLKRPPEHPKVIQTRFLLYTRSTRESPKNLHYDDDSTSTLQPEFNSTKSLKVIIHGYKGSGSDVGAILLVQAFLDIEDTNVLVLDWTRGAGTTYSVAVANTELVGRQLGLILLDIINLGTLVEDVHIIGFSLGAHVAGCASEILKKKNLLLGRITGLDPASPFFRNHLLREKSRKLDATDAQLVDVIHTDGSEDFADGFGLLKPIGHIDFFPNGGREQPGCNDVKNSVVVSHLRDMLTKEIACSHLRAWTYFLESVRTTNESCKFIAWPCSQGRMSYMNGMCFPMESTLWTQEMGYRADHGPLGIYYLPMREEEPFCGEPVRASVTTSEETLKTSGVLFLKIMEQNSTINFRFRYPILTRKNKGMTFYNIAAAKFQSLLKDRSTIKARIWYQKDKNEKNEDPVKTINTDILLIDKVTLEDRKGNRWEYCSRNTVINLEENFILLQRD
ncbi:pancreatic triacylglycerol lipase-like isoform X2 [Apis cerana]|uniref:pancreatic triacylglycerol lipase-like isoform X2 n=1 Tax=Apis cerana TaxID=7461 RepID=UPI0007E2C23F|nr:pancreatic triacylglycerol lipase-like isoform X2 [Apis cerana]